MGKLDYSTPVLRIDGTETDLEEYRGKVLLIVNTASECGFTPQFKGLEQIWNEYRDRGLVVLGFPCNQFGGQDPGTNEEIATFCQKNYGVTFPMHERIAVNGSEAHPLFVQLKDAAPGILRTTPIKWNFTKFLVGRDGEILDRFAPKDTPGSMKPDIEAALEA